MKIKIKIKNGSETCQIIRIRTAFVSYSIAVVALGGFESTKSQLSHLVNAQMHLIPVSLGRAGMLILATCRGDKKAAAPARDENLQR